jgi:hypothetical protein
LIITHKHPVRIEGKWCAPRTAPTSFEYELTEPMWIYNFILDQHHIVIVNGYECITLGHDLTDPELQDPYYGTDTITKDYLSHPDWPFITRGSSTETNIKVNPLKNRSKLTV